MLGFTRFMIGAAGGLVASASKILAIDIEKLQRFVDTGHLAEIGELKVTIYIFTPILMLLGALVAWASDEKHRMKLLAIGCAAPALIAPWTGGNLAGPRAAGAGTTQGAFQLISPAHAQDRAAGGTSYLTGIKVLLGLENLEDKRYWVIVGSRQDLAEAKAYAAEINRIDPSLQAFVSDRRPGNPNYPIIVGGPDAYLPLDEARKLQAKAQRVSIIPDDTFMSNYKAYKPRPAIE